jgi:hypothetical protein
MFDITNISSPLASASRSKHVSEQVVRDLREKASELELDGPRFGASTAPIH